MARNIRRISSSVCVLGIAFALGGAPALGAPYPNSPNQPVTPSGGPSGARSAAPVSAAGGGAASTSLPFTGGDVIGILAVGLGAAAAGTAAVTVARSRRRGPELDPD